MPARRVFYVLVFTTLLSMAGVLVPWLGRVALGLDLLLLLAVIWDHRQAGRVELKAHRQWPELLSQSRSAEVEVRLRAPTWPLTVELRETLHPGLASSPKRVRRTFDRPRLSWRYDLRPRQRGEHRCGPLTARVLGPWGLAWNQRRMLPPEPRKVFPQVHWDGKVGQLLLLAHRRALGSRPDRRLGYGSEPYALRKYLPGDSLNQIHWRASARHDRLITREQTWERGARLVVLLDCARGMSGLEQGRSKLDHALATCLALTRVAVARGDQVTVAAFSDRVERQVRVRAGRKHLQTAYAALYDLRPRQVEPAFDLAAEAAVAMESRRSTVVVLTSVVDLAAAELLRRAMLRLEQRHRPVLINLQDPELIRLTEEIAATPSEVFAQTAALEIMQANRRLATRLRHAGVRVVGTAADQLALKTLETYLGMFGR